MKWAEKSASERDVFRRSLQGRVASAVPAHKRFDLSSVFSFSKGGFFVGLDMVL
jgi:hypothetical protein